MNILFLQKRILFPTDNGGKVRTLNVVRYLARWHRVTYLANVQPGEEPYVPAMRELGVELELLPWREVPRTSWRFYRDLALNVASPYPFNVDKDYDPALRRRAEELAGSGRFDLVICDFVQMARNALGLPGPARVLFEHNVEAEIFERTAAAAGPATAWFYRYQRDKMTQFEAHAGRDFDGVVAVSPRDAEVFRRRYGWDHVEAIDTAVDVEAFHPDPSIEEPERVVFCGSMDWPPNADGMLCFLREVWPQIRRARPAARLHIVGRNPGPALTRWHGRDGVEVSGTVPDVRPLVARAAVVVVPLNVGGGTRIKIFEAMALAKPVVSTRLGAEGLPVTSGENCLIADDPAEFARATTALLSDAARRRELGTRARRLVEERFSAETVARQFEAICQRAIDRRATGGGGDRSASSAFPAPSGAGHPSG